MTRLTKQRLEAIREALANYMAGVMSDDGISREEFEAALRWANEQLTARSKRQ